MNEVWNLDPIYKGFEDSAFAADMEKLSALAGEVNAFAAGLKDMEPLSGLKRGIDLTEQPFVASSAISRFIGDCGMQALLARMDFARELTSLFRKLSPRLFSKEGDRQRLVEAAQEHLDGLIAEENETAEEEVAS